MNFRISKYVTIFQEKLLKNSSKKFLKYFFNLCKKQTKYEKVLSLFYFLLFCLNI